MSGFGRHEDHANRVLALGWQSDARFFGDELQEIMRGLDEDACSVSSIRFAAARAAMIEIAQSPESLLNDRVGFPALDIHHEPDSA
jgi:hypothetical protein